MRRIVVWLMSTLTAVVLLFSYRTSTMGTGAAAASGSPGGAATNPSAPLAAGSAPAGGSTYQGSIAQTRWGPVQVDITILGGKIVDVSVPTYPNGNGRDREINAYALP